MGRQLDRRWGRPGPGRAVPAAVRSAWQRAGRSGEPRLAALGCFSLGEDEADQSRGYLRDYYGFLGAFAEQIAAARCAPPAAIRAAVSAFTDIGCTEFYLDPTTSSPDQVDRLAGVLR